MKSSRFVLIICLTAMICASCSIDPYRKSVELYDEGEYESAENSLEEALLSNKGNAEAYFYLGKSLKAQDRLEEAIQAFDKAYEIDQDYPTLAFELGVAMAQAGISHDSIMYLRRSVIMDPENVEAFYWLGVALERSGNLEDAGLVYANVLSLDPERTEVLEKLHGVSVNLHEKRNAFDKTVETIQANMAEGPDKDFALGQLHMEYGEPAEAVRHFASCLEADSLNGAACYNLARCLEDDAHYTDALDVLEEGVAAGLESPEIYDELTNLYLMLDRREDALNAYGKYLDIMGESPLTEKQIRRFNVDEKSD